MIVFIKLSQFSILERNKVYLNNCVVLLKHLIAKVSNLVNNEFNFFAK